jgi:hypothetical protein
VASILFTDSDGTWKLHNGKPHPADRFRSWTPHSLPVGDAAARLSDGAITMFRFRDDFGVTFDLEHIPSRRATNLALRSEDFGTTWTVYGTPTRSAAAHTKSGIVLDLIGDDSGAAVEGYGQVISFAGDSGTKGLACCVKAGTIQPAAGSEIVLSDNTAGANRFRTVLTFSGSAPVVTTTIGTYLGYELLADYVYRLLFLTTNVTAANSNEFLVRPAMTSGEQGNIYIGGIQADHARFGYPTDYLHTTSAARTDMSLADLADRLRRHLLNGGSCTIYTSDAAGSSYATCGLKPGTTPSLQLSDRRALEFTFSAQLVNLAGSPVRMSAYYNE